MAFSQESGLSAYFFLTMRIVIQSNCANKKIEFSEFMAKTEKLTAGFAITLGLSAIFAAEANACTPQQIKQRVRADYAMDVATGTVLYEKNAQVRISPASITKQMVALLAFRDIRDGKLDPDQWITLTSVNLKGPGTVQNTDPIDWGIEQVRLENGLYAMLRRSSNRVPNWFENPEFIARMNATVGELGLKNTHFVNTTGYPTLQEQQSAGTPTGHYSSAEDLAKISAALMREFPDAIQSFSKPKEIFTGLTAKGRGVKYEIATSVNLLPGAGLSTQNVEDGKTGFICRSGHNLTVIFNIDGRKIAFVSVGHNVKADRDNFVRHMAMQPTPEMLAGLQESRLEEGRIRFAKTVDDIFKPQIEILPGNLETVSVKPRPEPLKDDPHPKDDPYRLPIITIRLDYPTENRALPFTYH